MTQKRVKASDVIGNSYYIYTLQSSNNTPSLNSTINITCNVTDVYGQAISGKSITLYQNNTSKGAKTTDSSGNASWNSISMSSAGLQVFKVENSKIEVFVDNKSDVGHTHSQYLTEHQSIKTINNESLIGVGNIDLSTNDIQPIEPVNGTIDFNSYTETGKYATFYYPSTTSFLNAPYKEIYPSNSPIILLDVEDVEQTIDYSGETEDEELVKQTLTIIDYGQWQFNIYSRIIIPNNSNYNPYWKPLTYETQRIDPTSFINLDYWSESGSYVYIPPEDTSNVSYSNFPQGMNRDNWFVLLVQSHQYPDEQIIHQTLFTDNEIYVRRQLLNWVKIGATVDATWVNNSTNPIQSKVIKDALDNKLDKTHSSYKGKNVVTNATTGDIEFEDKPIIPSASSTTPSADTENGSVGTGTTWARSNHTHPKSSLYAESSHTHTDKEDAIEFITGTTTSSGNVLGGTSTKLNSLQNGTKILYKTPTQSSTDSNTVYLQLTLASGTTSQNYLCDATGGFLATKEIPANTVLLLVYVTSFQSRWQIISRSNDATTNSSGLMSKTDKAKLDGLSNFSGSYNDLTDKPTIPTATSDLTNDSGFLTSHQDISGKIDTAGTGLSKSGTTLNHSNSVTALTTASFKKVKYDSQGHITGTSDVGASDLPSHTHSQYLTEHQSLSNYYNKSETNNYDVDFILGTQTTSTSAWTGTTDVISSLREGTTIFYKLPYASTSTSVTLNLTLKGGGTTGAKNVFYKNTTRLTTHFGVGQVVGLTYDGTAWYVISPSDNNSNNDNNYGGIQFKAGEALTTQTICCAKVDGMYYKVANGVVLDIRYPLIMTSSAVTSETTTNAMYRTWYGVNIANTKSMTLTNGLQLFLEGTAYSDGKFTISSNVVTHTLTNGRYYIKVGTALSTTQIRFISDMTVYYYNGTTLKPVIKKEQIVDFPTIPSKTSDLTNDSGFLTSHQSLSGYLQTSDVKDNLTSTDTNKPLSAKQGKELKTLVDGKANTNHTHDALLHSNDDSDVLIFEPTAQGYPNGEGIPLGAFLSEFWRTIYPVGSIYMSVNSTSPATLFGGTWEQIEDTFLLASGNTYNAGSTGGSADAVVVSHNHTQASHTHTTSRNYPGIDSSANWAYSSKRQMSSTSGSYYYPYSTADTNGISEPNTMTTVTPTINSQGVSGTGKNMPPYLVVYVWKRTA